MYEINDIRDIKDFKGVSFSKFKKSDVQKQFIQSVLDSSIEPACYWGCELICAGHFKDLWDLIILIFSKHIHSSNPKLAVYLDRRLSAFADILNNGYLSNELRMRNNEKIRKMFAEIISIITFAKKNHPFEEIKIKKLELTQETKLKAPDLTFATCFKKDPKQLFVPLNEFAYALKTKNIYDACYWITWFIDYDCHCRSNKTPLLIERRTFLKNLNQNVVWMLWDTILETSKNADNIVITIIKSLLNIFAKKYSVAENKKKIFIFYFAVSLLIGPNQYSNISDNMEEVDAIVDNIHSIYKQIKINEVSPNTDYLFTDVKNTNLEKTIEKLEKMESFTNTFIPRI
jgi:hypothetical protein